VKEEDKKIAYKLEDYIAEFYGSNVDFAKDNAVSKQQVSNWISDKYIVVDNVLYSERRKIKKV